MRTLLVFLLLFTVRPALAGIDRLEIESLLATLHSREQFSGVVLVAKKGNIRYWKAFGYADPETGESLKRDSIFALASVTKTFTAVAILILEEQKKLNLSDRVGRYLPAFPYKEITIRQLLNHTSGVPDYMVLFQQHWDPSRVANNRDVVQMLAQQRPPLRFHPGERWEYSNTGYVLLASIIEAASGKSYREFLRSSIFELLGMDHSDVYTHDDSLAVPEIVSGLGRNSLLDPRYTRVEGIPRFQFVSTLGNIIGDKGVFSTAEDLLRWDRALYNGRILSQKTLRQAFEPATTKQGTAPYGMGWFLRQGEGGSREVWHSGNWPGFISTFIRNIDLDQTVVILTNTTDSAVAGITNAIQNILSDRAYHFPKQSLARTLGPVILNDGVEEGIRTYYDWRKNRTDDFLFAESELNNLGYALMERNLFCEALEVFRLNVEAYPDSWNVYDSLGEAYVNLGEIDNAVRNYEKSLALNPRNWNGMVMLSRIKNLPSS